MQPDEVPAIVQRLLDEGAFDLDVANLNQDGSFKFLAELGYPVTRRMIKYAFDRRELVPIRLGVGNYVSRRDLLRWVESRRQPGFYQAPKSGAAVAK